MSVTAIEDLLRATATTSEISGFFGRNPELFSGAGKLRTEDDDSVVSTLFGVPVGFQFGTAAGLEGLPAIFVDIVTDPTTYLLGGIGALTRTGRLARTAGRAGKSDDLIDAKFASLMDGVNNVQNVSGAQKAKAIETLFRIADGVDTTRFNNLSKMIDNAESTVTGGNVGLQEAGRGLARKVDKVLRDTERLKKLDDPAALGRARRELFDGLNIPGFEADAVPDAQELRAFREALARGGLPEARSFVDANIAKLSNLSSEYGAAAKSGDWRRMREAARALTKTRPTRRHRVLFNDRRLKELGRLFAAGDSNRLANTLADQNALGQRRLLQLQAPFTNFGIAIPVPGEHKAFGLLDKAIEKAPSLGRMAPRGGGLVSGAQIAAKDLYRLSGEPVYSPDTLFSIGQATVQAVRGVPNDAEDFAGLHRKWIGERVFSKDAAHQFGRHFEVAVPDAEERWRLLMIGDNPDKFLHQGSTAAGFQRRMRDVTKPDGTVVQVPQVTASGPFGRTSAFGDLKDPDMLSDVDNLEYVQAIRTTLDEVGEELLRLKMIENSAPNYIPRMVKRVKDQKAFDKFTDSLSDPQVADRFYKHGLERKIPFLDDLLELEKQGAIEVEKDAAKVLTTYLQETGEVAANRRFIEKMDATPIKVTNGPQGHPVMVGRNSPQAKAIQADPQLRSLYVDAEDLKEVRNFTKRVMREGRVGGRPVTPFQDGAFIHKSAKRHLQTLFAEGIPRGRGFAGVFDETDSKLNTVARAALLLNGLSKRMLLSFSAFHHAALTESFAVAVGNPWGPGLLRPDRLAKAAASPFIEGLRLFGVPLQPSFMNRELRRVRTSFPGRDIMHTASNAGLQLGDIIDAERDVINRAARAVADSTVASRIPLARQSLNRIADFDSNLQTGLWDVMHSGYKAFAFNELYHRGLERFPGLPADKIARDVADHVNNAFGGQIWERFFLGRRGQQWMRAFIMAPDWTLSNLRVAWDVFGNLLLRGSTAAADLTEAALASKPLAFLSHTGPGAAFRESVGVGAIGKAFRFDAGMIQSADVRAAFAREYALRVGFIAYPMASLANYAMTGHWMDQNEEGHTFEVDTGVTDESGRRIFWGPGKQFKEPFKLATDPLSTANFKKSPLLTGAVSLIPGLDIFGSRVYFPEDSGWLKIAKSLGYISKSATPIQVQKSFSQGDGSDSPFDPAEAVGIPFRRGAQPAQGFSLPNFTNEFRRNQREGSLSAPVF